MKKIALFLFALCSIHLSLNAQHGARDTAKTVPPFKIFDNLYYVGMDWVSAYLLKTDDGLILIDALYGKFPAHILQSVRELGFDPKQIKYVLITHGHYDHNEGADTIKKVTGARIGMTDADWKMIEGKLVNPYPGVSDRNFVRDLVIKDGDSLRLGHTTLKFYVTPGHTEGVLSMSFPVIEGKNTYRAFVFGGAGLNFEGVQRTQMYIQSIDRLLGMPDLLQVNISNHPNTGKILDRAAALKQRKAGEKNPFVAPDDYIAWLKDMRAQAEKKLVEEKAKEKQ